MKITAMIVCYNEQDFIGYCLESIKDIVDEIVICDGGSTDTTITTIKNLKEQLQKTKVEIFFDNKRDDYSYIRNECLKRATGDWILWVDADEILANIDGSPVTREQLEKLINSIPNALSYDLFTFHFLYNYRWIDGRLDGRHWSMDRIFKRVVSHKNNLDITIDRNVQFVRPMHEVIQWYPEDENYHSRSKSELVIWHFGGCKTLEATRRKYAQNMRVFPAFFEKQIGIKDVNEYCRIHELFRMTRPMILYEGPLPQIMKLW